MTAAADRLRVAVLGAGYFAQYHLDAWVRIEEVELVGVCSTRREQAEDAARRFGIPRSHARLERMLDQARPDLLDVVTPPATHLEAIRTAAERGIAVVCQKPFCGDLEAARSAARIAQEADTVLVVHENFRFQPWYRELARMCDEGLVGRPLQLQYRLRPGDGRGPDAYLARQPYFREMSRFLLHETGIHLVDTFRFLLGEVGAVYARLRRLNPGIAGEDAGVVLMEFASGAQGLFEGNRLLGHATDDPRRTMGELSLEGESASVRLDGFGRLWVRRDGQTVEREHAYRWSDRGFGGDCVHALQRHVVEHLLRGAVLENPARDYLRNLQIEEAAYLSHAQGRRIELPPVAAGTGRVRAR